MDGFDRHAKAITNLYHVLDTGYKLISVEKEKMQSIKVAHERLMSSDSTLRCSITELKKRRWKDRRLGTARS